MKSWGQVIVSLVLVLLVKTAFAETFIAHCRHSPPEMIVVDGDCSGIVPEMLVDILAELNHDVKWLEIPFPRSLAEAKLANVDILIRHSMTDQRRGFLDGHVYGDFERVIEYFLAPNFESDITSPEDLKTVNIGALRYYYYSTQFHALDPDSITWVTETPQLIKMLRASRVDAVITSKRHAADLYRSEFRKASYSEQFTNPLYISFAKASPKSVYQDEIAEVLLEYRKSGRVDQYFISYGMEPPVQVFD
ncbi:substrate-binding periplasmic protein [Reinekea marinisedimentorum]|uniref:Polar amino acid transport system substrate-binding protein n=1 Tax=Reinekea marinisedimentorum TaxID=230495 RepID=A0A4R3I6M4_9GAMM|nr:transporter substrate-binding domain-containing protein [Reinekea marinisedimentorum]TCS41626.1 polar amino acid transport system substrate-binding protein [Reinekea marinisedimentorum]